MPSPQSVCLFPQWLVPLELASEGVYLQHERYPTAMVGILPGQPQVPHLDALAR